MRQRRIRRLAPCPAYDVERIESWLTDMAKEGWILEKDGEIFGWLAFMKEAPRNLRYRLEPKKEGTSFGDVPDQDIRDLCQEYGWDYVDSYGNFFIYRSDDPQAREMNTDLLVQATALKAGKQSSTITLVLDTLLVYSMLGAFLAAPCWSLVHMGLAFHLAHFAALIWINTEYFLQRHHLRKLHSQLKANIPLNHSKPWRKGAPFHLFSKFGYTLVLLVLFGVIFSSCTQSYGLNRTETVDYPGTPPFATAADILAEGSFTSKRFLDGYNTYTEDSNYFTPRVLKWREYGEIILPDGSRYDGILNITYYETRWPWLAEGLMEDLYRLAKDESHFAALSAPELAVEDIICYNYIYPTVLIRQGNILVEANVGLEHQGNYLLEQWAQRMAEMLIHEQ